MPGNEVEIVVRSKDQTGAGIKAAKESFKGLEQSSTSLAGGFDRVGERADKSEQRVLGMKDTVDGVATIMAGPGKQGIAAYLQGYADLASGLANFVFPALAGMTRATVANAVATVRSTAASVAQRAVLVAGAVATGVMTAAQWALNAALTANPIGIVIVAIAALIAILVVAYRRSATFRAIVDGAFRSVRAAASSLASGAVAAFNALIRGASRAGSLVTSFLRRIPAFLAGLPGQMFSIGRGIIQGLINGVRAQLGALGSVLGGVARFITEHKGPPEKDRKLLVPAGQSIMAGLMEGIGSQLPPLRGQLEGVTAMAGGAGRSGGRAAGPAGGVARVELHISSGGSRWDDVLVEALRKAIGARGGDVQVVLGR